MDHIHDSSGLESNLSAIDCGPYLVMARSAHNLVVVFVEMVPREPVEEQWMVVDQGGLGGER